MLRNIRSQCKSQLSLFPYPKVKPSFSNSISIRIQSPFNHNNHYMHHQTPHPKKLLGTLKELDKFYNTDRLDKALEVLDSLEKKGVTVNLPRYAQLLEFSQDNVVTRYASDFDKFDGYCKQNSLVMAVTVLRKLEDKGITINLNKYVSLLKMHGNVGIVQYAGTIEELDVFCSENNMEDALGVLDLLKKKGISVDLPRFGVLMEKCGVVGNVDYAKSIHRHVVGSLGKNEVSVHDKIIDMYSKCGSVSDAYEVFENVREHNLASWGAMISCLAENGLGEDAIDLFTEFKKLGLKPNRDIFMGLFLACSNVGDMTEGMLHFEMMSRVYGILPSMEHYIGVVNMLGSAGYLDEAKEFIEKMPVVPDVVIWETLMNLCRVYGNSEVGDHCLEIVKFLVPCRVTEKLKDGLVPVKASDFAKEKVKISDNSALTNTTFRVGDTSHPNSDKIYALSRKLNVHMKEAGYVPHIKSVSYDIDVESKEEFVIGQSERLALADGLLQSPPRHTVRILKKPPYKY